MTDLAAYGFSVDSTSVVKAAKDLDQMSAASAAASRAGQQFGEATNALKQRLDQLSQSQQQQLQVLQSVIAMQTQIAQMMTMSKDQTQAFTGALTAMNTTSVDSTRAMAEMNAQLGKVSDGSVKAATSINLTREALIKAEGAATAAASDFGTFAKQLDAVGLSGAELGGAVERVNQAMTRMTPAAKQVRDEIERLGVSLKGMKSGDEVEVITKLIGKYQEYADTRSKNESIFVTTGLKSEEAIKKIGSAYIDVSDKIKTMSLAAKDAARAEEEYQKKTLVWLGLDSSARDTMLDKYRAREVNEAASRAFFQPAIKPGDAATRSAISSLTLPEASLPKLVSMEDIAAARAMIDAVDTFATKTRELNEAIARTNDLRAKGLIDGKQYFDVLNSLSIKFNDGFIKGLDATKEFVDRQVEASGAIERVAAAQEKLNAAFAKTRQAMDEADARAAQLGMPGHILNPFADAERARLNAGFGQALPGRDTSVFTPDQEVRAAQTRLDEKEERVDKIRDRATETARLANEQMQLKRVLMDSEAPQKNLNRWNKEYADDLHRLNADLRERVALQGMSQSAADDELYSFRYKNEESFRSSENADQRGAINGEFNQVRRAEMEAYFSTFNSYVGRGKGVMEAWVAGLDAAHLATQRFVSDGSKAVERANEALMDLRDTAGMDPTSRAVERARRAAVAANKPTNPEGSPVPGIMGNIAGETVNQSFAESAERRMTSAKKEAEAIEQTAKAYGISVEAGQRAEAQGRANIEAYNNGKIGADALTEAMLRLTKGQMLLTQTREAVKASSDLLMATNLAGTWDMEASAAQELRIKEQALATQRTTGANADLEIQKLRKIAVTESIASTNQDLTQRRAALDIQEKINAAGPISVGAATALRKELEVGVQVRKLEAAAAIAMANGDLKAAEAADLLATKLRAVAASERESGATESFNSMKDALTRNVELATKELSLVNARVEVQQTELTVYREMASIKERNLGWDQAQLDAYERQLRGLQAIRQKTDEARRANEEWGRVAQRVTDRLVDGFTAGKFAVKDFAAFAIDMFKEIARNSIIRPLISPIIYGAFGANDPHLGGGGMFSDIGKSIAGSIFTDSVKDSFKDVFSPLLNGLKQMFSPDNFIANMFPSIFGTTSTIAGVSGITGAALGVPASAMFGAGTGAAVAGESALAAGVAGPLAAMAPFLPILAIVLPLLLSTIFKKKESVGPNANAVINLEGGSLAVGGIGADNGGDASIAKQMAEAVTKGMKEIMKSIGGSISGFGGAGDIEKTQVGYFKGKYFSMVDGKREEFGQAEAAVTDFIVRALKHADISGISTTMRQVLTRTTADTMEELGKVIDFTKLYERNFVAANAYENQMKAMAETFDEWRDMTRELGLDMGKTEGAISKMRTAAINAFHDVGTVAEELMKKVADGVVGFGSSMDKTAASLDYAINQTKAAATSYRSMGTALRGTASGLRISDLSTLSPADKLVEAQSQYGAAMTKAKGGDQEAAQQAQQLAQRVLELARGMFASGSGYTAIYDQIQGDLMGAANAQDAIAIRLDVQTVLLTAQRDILLEIRELMDEATKRMGDVSTLSNLGFAQDLTDPARIKYDELLTRLSTFLGNTPGAATDIATIRTAIGNNQVTAAEATSITGARDSLEAKVQGKLASEIGTGSDLYVSWNALSAALEYNRTTADSLGTVIRSLGETFRNIATIFGGVASSPIQNMGALSALMTNLGTFVGGIAGVNPPASIATFLTSLQTFATSIVGIADLNLTQFTAITIAIQAVGTGLNVLSGVSVSSTDIEAIFSTTATWFGTLGTMQNDPAIRAAIGPTGVLSSLNGVIAALASTTTSSVPGVVSTTTGLPAVSLSLSNFSSALAAAALPPAISALTGALGAADSGLQSSLTGAKTAAGDFKKAIDDLVKALTDNIRNIDGMIGARAVQIDKSAITGGTTAAFNTLAQRASTYVGSVAQVLGGAPDQTQLSQLSGWQWAISKRQEIIGAATSENDLKSILDRFYGGTRERTASTVDQGINEILDRIKAISSGAGGGPTGPTNFETQYRQWLRDNPRQLSDGGSEIMQPDQFEAFNHLRALDTQGIAPEWYRAFRSWWDAGHVVDDMDLFAMGDLITGRSTFNFSSRARMGQVGEAGEEFIMPATRTSSGAMGVRAVMPEDDEGNEILGRISSKLSSIHDVLVDQVEQADDHHSTLTRQNATFAGSRASVSGTRSP